MKRYLLLLAIVLFAIPATSADCSGCGEARGSVSTQGGCLIIQMASICNGGTCVTDYIMCSGMQNPGGGTSCTCDDTMTAGIGRKGSRARRACESTGSETVF